MRDSRLLIVGSFVGAAVLVVLLIRLRESDGPPAPGAADAPATQASGSLFLYCAAGVKNPAVEATHKRQRIFFGHYAFRGGMGYGEHPYGIGGAGNDYNGKQPEILRVAERYLLPGLL